MSHLFYVPHADDEVLSLGVAILKCLELGEEVHLILMTDGSACGSIRFLNGDEHCGVHDCFHNPIDEMYRDGILDEQDHVTARTREFLAVSRIYGIDPDHLHVYGYKDGRLTVDQARTVVLRMENDGNIPGPKTHHTMTARFDNHNDHISCGTALAELHREGKIGAPHWYVKRSLWGTLPDDAPIEDLVATEGQAVLLRRACEEVYMRWEPGEGHYAVGYHSVPMSFDGLLGDFRNKVHHEP